MAREIQAGDKVITTRIIPVTRYKVTQGTTSYLAAGTVATFVGCSHFEDDEPLFIIELVDGTLVTDVDAASLTFAENL